MTENDIIRMALEAELIQDFGESGTFLYHKHKLERFFNLAFAAGAAHEREACAKVCEENAKRYQIAGMMVADECAAAIRSRGEK